jgi:hypothetical protein
MPLRLIDPKIPVEWVHPSERPKPGEPAKEGATVFHIVTLTEGQSRTLKAKHPTKFTGTETIIDIDGTMSDMFMACVIKIDGVVWPGTTEPVSISTDADKTRFLGCIPAEYMGPVYAAIQNQNLLDEGTRKN